MLKMRKIQLPLQMITISSSELPLPTLLCATSNGSLIISSISIFKKAMLETWKELPLIFITSAADKKGGDDIWNFIESEIS